MCVLRATTASSKSLRSCFRPDPSVRDLVAPRLLRLSWLLGLAMPLPRQQPSRRTRRTTGSPRLSGSHAARGRRHPPRYCFLDGIGRTPQAKSDRPASADRAIASRGEQWRKSGDLRPLGAIASMTPAPVEHVIGLPRQQASRRARCTTASPGLCGSDVARPRGSRAAL